MGAGDLPKQKPEPAVALTFLRLARRSPSRAAMPPATRC